MLFTRPDGSLARDVPAYRRIMPYLMRGKNESAAYFEQELDLTETQAFIERWNATSPLRITLFHVYLWAVIQTLAARPRLNRFVAGSRIYDRDGIWISYSAKKAMRDDAPVVVLKKRFEAGRPFGELVEQLHGHVSQGRSDEKSHVDKELSLVLALPSLLVRALIALQRWLDAWNLLPSSLIRPDPMYASMFVANLGSLKLEAVHHHLYEYGNIPIFACIGRSKRVVAVDERGAVTTRLVATVKYTYDERVEDGLYCAAALGHLQKLVERPAEAGLERGSIAQDRVDGAQDRVDGAKGVDERTSANAA
ncbi:MAG: 2-oxo acid dehydrogenase subunit E2 [Labilithrix sp.]|nr:2-oxo acid dehydrogenase subunit E2 [Labilithrix sp.]